MASKQRIGLCDYCGKGRVTWRLEEIAFRQWSDKGYVHCRATLPVGTCHNCQAKSLEESSDRIFDAAFQEGYDKLR